jgi:hypothetical protein
MPRLLKLWVESPQGDGNYSGGGWLPVFGLLTELETSIVNIDYISFIIPNRINTFNHDGSHKCVHYLKGPQGHSLRNPGSVTLARRIVIDEGFWGNRLWNVFV